MRIAIFSDNFQPELSGISDSIIALAKELAERGHFINFYVPKYSENDYKLANLPYGEIELGKNIKITRFSSLHFGAGTGQGRAVIPLGLRYLTVKKFKPDVIHTQLFFGVGLEALVASRILKIPLIGTNHTAIKEFLRYAPIRSRWLDSMIIKYVNWYYSRCNLTTAPSHSVIDEMRFFGFKGEAHVISNPIDTETFSPLPNKNWLRKKFNFGEYAIIHAGRLADERNIDVIIRAMPLIKKKIPQIELFIAGRGAAEKKLKKLAEDTDVASSVKFMGFLEKPVLAEVYNASKIFVITSTSDTQSMVMMQAMASGLPIIGVKARALPEYINPKNGVLTEPGNERMLARNVISLFRNPEKRKRLSEGARRFANKFSIKSITREWEEIYAHTIKNYGDKK